MDIFNKKKVADLEVKLAMLEDKYRRQSWDLDEYKEKLKQMSELAETVPTDCVRGPWCQACEFVKTFHYNESYGLGGYSTITAYVCGKGESCKHFIQKESNACKN